MTIFKIATRLEKNGKWPDSDYSFEGYIMLDEKSNTFKGYLEDKMPTKIDPLRSIIGIFNYTTSNDLAFVQITNEPKVLPLMCIFKDFNCEGYWTTYNNFSSMGFYGSKPKGKATVTLSKVADSTLKVDIIKKFERINSDDIKNYNRDILNNINELSYFINI